MQMLSKVIKLELQYSCQQNHIYQRQICYLAPYPAESAEHLAKRLLSYLLLFELQPQWLRQPHSCKKPDLFLQDQQQHYLLWCQVDIPNEKQLQRAAHQSVRVLLVPDAAELPKIKQLSKGLNNVSVMPLNAQQIDSCCQMLKGHMALSMWREEQQLLITDGRHVLELELTDNDLGSVWSLLKSVAATLVRH